MTWSWRMPAKLARERAARCRRVAERHQTGGDQAHRMQRLLQDEPAALAWVMGRVAQELEQFADECLRLSNDKDVTAVERGPRRG
jgi:hypothetical protein